MPQGRRAAALLPVVREFHDPRKRPVVYLASTMPGLGPLLIDEIQRHPKLRYMAGPYDDGRSDIALFQAARGMDPLEALRIAEDMFVLVGITESDADAQRLASRLITREGLERALGVHSRLVAPIQSAMTYRVIARVLSERHFRRTSLRSVISATIARHRPRWTVADPSSLEIWVQELKGDAFVATLRLSNASLRQKGGRVMERHGALRPAVAAAMVSLAGEPDGTLIDPFCGTGTILAEAVTAGWIAEGHDIDGDAVTIAQLNVPLAHVTQGDARKLDRSDGSTAAIVSNLPFGRQYTADTAVLEAAMQEMDRVTMPGGRVVLLHPSPLPALPVGLEIREHHELRLLGVPATIWALVNCRDVRVAHDRGPAVREPG